MIFANPDAWCSSGSPGGGTYGVLSSSDFARAMSASCACGAAGTAANSRAAATGNVILMPHPPSKPAGRQSSRVGKHGPKLAGQVAQRLRVACIVGPRDGNLADEDRGNAPTVRAGQLTVDFRILLARVADQDETPQIG